MIKKEKEHLCVINPGKILEMNVISSYENYPEIITDLKDSECQIQQNGIDLRIASAAEAIGHTTFSLHKRFDRRCTYIKINPGDDALADKSSIVFQPNKMYSIDFMEWIEVPDNMCAYIIMRSSINRYSGSIFSGWWDSGFKGRLGAIFRPNIFTTIEIGCRVAQIIFLQADAYRSYNGQYQNQQSHYKK